MVNQLMNTTTLTSDKITGDGDRNRLETDLSAVDGVRDVEVDTNNHTVTVTYNPTVVSEARLLEVMQSDGYTGTQTSSPGLAREEDVESRAVDNEATGDVIGQAGFPR